MNSSLPSAVNSSSAGSMSEPAACWVNKKKEIRWHQNNWRRQGEAVRAIQKAKVDLASEIDSIIGTYEDGTEMSEAS